MKLSLSEAATVLGKTERQLRYMIKAGRLGAAKQDGQWRIESSELPLTDAQRQSLAERLGAARVAFDKGVEAAAKVVGDTEKQRRYTVTDLTAFQVGAAIYRELVGALGVEATACRLLSSALTAVACGFHDFQPADKAKRFSEARSSAAAAVAALLLEGEEQRVLGARIEQELIPKISGLVASCERRSHRSRFESFGSSVFPSRSAR